MPLLVWLNLVMCGMVLMVISPLTAAQIMLLLDRFLGSHFFDTQAGGLRGALAALLLDLWPPRGVRPHPAGFAFASEIIPVFRARRSLAIR